MNDNHKEPAITPELLAYLDSVYPDRCPSLSAADREVWWKAGERNVVNHLAALKARQDESALGTVFPDSTERGPT